MSLRLNDSNHLDEEGVEDTMFENILIKTVLSVQLKEKMLSSLTISV